MSWSHWCILSERVVPLACGFQPTMGVVRFARRGFEMEVWYRGV